MNLPSGFERRHLVLAGTAVVVLIGTLLSFTGGSDEGSVDSTTSGTGSTAAAPVVPAEATPSPAGQAAPGSTSSEAGSSRGMARTSRGPDTIARTLESQLTRSLPPAPRTEPRAAPRPSQEVQNAGALLRGWHDRRQTCLRAASDFRDCDTSTPVGVRLVNVSDMGASYSLTSAIGNGTVVTLAVVRGTQCRSTSTLPRDCDAWR